MRSTPRPRARGGLRARGAALAAIALVLLSACPDLPDGPRYQGAGNSTPQKGGTLLLSESSRVRTLDPHIAFDVVSSVVLEMMFDGLYSYDHDMQLVPMLAAALPEVSPEGTTLVVRLRQGVRFHHGRELTADDVVWSLERMLHPDTHSPGAGYFSALEGFEAYRAGKAKHVKGLKALDRYTVELKLTRPDQSFIHVLAMRFAVPIPKEEVERLGKDFARRPVGTGAFRLVSWDPGVRLVLERNPHYFRAGLPHLDGVVFEEAIPQETAFLRFRNGEVDIITRMTPADRAFLVNSPKWRPYVATSPSVDVYGLTMNCELWPFDNVHVRRAVAFAIDRERWARVRNGSIRPAGQMVPPELPGYDPKLPNLQRFDLARAREEMRLAGYPDGLPKPVTLWTVESSGSRLYGQLAQADLAKIGIKVELKMVSFPVYLEATATEKTAQMFSGGWVMDFPDPSNFLGLLHSSVRAPRESLNKAFYNNPELDALLDAAIVERDQARRVELYRRANDIVARDAPWAFFANQQSPQAYQPYVKGYRPHPSYWLPVNEVWLDLPRKRAEALAARLSSPWGAMGALAERSVR